MLLARGRAYFRGTFVNEMDSFDRDRVQRMLRTEQIPVAFLNRYFRLRKACQLAGQSGALSTETLALLCEVSGALTKLKES